MKLSSLIHRAKMSLELWGDKDVYLDVFADGEIYLLGDFIGELGEDGKEVEHLLLTGYETRAKLSVVK